MKDIYDIEFYTGSKEEILPDFTSDFPCITSRTKLNPYVRNHVPWHWHKAVELFYIESGGLEYHTPSGKKIFRKGSGGLINSNVLHMTQNIARAEETVQLLHIFDTSFLAGWQGSRIEQRYITPITAASQVEIIALDQEDEVQAQILEQIRDSFFLSDEMHGYEMRLRTVLSEIWLQLFDIAVPLLERKANYGRTNEKIKMMMIYIHENYQRKISIGEVAGAAYISERECFRIFHDHLHMTPAEYITGYRLQIACHLLAETQDSITEISHACCLGSNSYFGKLFREHMGCTPVEYRMKWRNNDR